MQSKFLSLCTPSIPGMGPKGENISSSKYSHVAYQIKGLKRTITSNKYFDLTHTLDPWGRAKRSNHFSSESGPVAYLISVKVGYAFTMVTYTMGGMGEIEGRRVSLTR